MIKTSSIVAEAVAWYNKDEYDEVYRGLFSSNLFKMRWAVDRITVWGSRCHPVLGIGIDATASIVRALIQDDLYQTNTSLCQPPDLQLMYSQALTRFVNCISETQRSEHYGVPVRVAALKLGIPQWIIHTRNNASHSRVPALSNLREACLWALQWLKENFWDIDNCNFANFSKGKDLIESRIENTLTSFLNIQYELLFTNESKKINRSKMKECLAKMRASLRKQKEDFINVLLKPGVFLLSTPTLKDILNHRSESFFVETNTVDLPSSLEELWAPVVQLLLEENCIQEFLESLLQCLSSKDQLQQKTAACWVHKLIQSGHGNPLNEISEDDKPSLNWFRLLGSCVENCCMYSPALLPIIVDKIKPPFRSTDKGYIMALVAVYVGATSSPSRKKKKSAVSKTFTVDTIKEDLKLRGVERYEKNRWVDVPEDTVWSTVPLGSVFTTESDFTTNVLPVCNDYEVDASTMPAENAITCDDKCSKSQDGISPKGGEANDANTESENSDAFPVEYHPEKMMLYPPKLAVTQNS